MKSFPFLSKRSKPSDYGTHFTVAALCHNVSAILEDFDTENCGNRGNSQMKIEAFFIRNGIWCCPNIRTILLRHLRKPSLGNYKRRQISCCRGMEFLCTLRNGVSIIKKMRIKFPTFADTLLSVSGTRSRRSFS